MTLPNPPNLDVPRWCYQGGISQEPPLSQRQTGWTAVPGQNYGQIPPYQWENWLKFSAGEWINYLNLACPYGIFPYSTTQVYSIGSVVQDGNGYAYISLQNNNQNNPLTNTSFWAQQHQNGIVTPNTMNQNTVVTSGNTLTWPNLTIASNITLTINSGGNFIGIDSVGVAGTVNVAGSGIII